MRRFSLVILFCLLALPAKAAGLVADLSHHLVAITTAFAGSDVLVFGTTGGPGRDVVIVVRGPDEEAVVLQRSRVAFLWLGTARIAFDKVPVFYTVAASRPLNDLSASDELVRNQIGLDRLRLTPTLIEGVGDRRTGDFQEALIRRKAEAGLFQPGIRPVTFIGDRLFRTTLNFPANVPPGTYQVRTFEIENGVIVAAQTSSLIISKVGLEAALFDYAHQDAWLYGIVSIALAVGAGWTANMVFRKS